MEVLKQRWEEKSRELEDALRNKHLIYPQSYGRATCVLKNELSIGLSQAAQVQEVVRFHDIGCK